MTLTTLPYLVLDDIFQRLSKQSLLALSSTCQYLHLPANKCLYNDLEIVGWANGERKKLLEVSLDINPANVQFARVYTATSFDGVKRLLSKTPLRLKKLIIEFEKWDGKISATAWRELFSSIHPDTWIHAVKGFGTAFWAKPGAVLSQLYHVSGLVHLDLDLDREKVQLKHLLGQINCPQLKHINLRNVAVNWHVVPDSNLQNLRSMRFDFNSRQRYENPLDKIMQRSTYEYIKVLMAKGIFLQITKWRHHDCVFSFFRTVHQFATETELQSIIPWIVDGERYFQTNIGGQLGYCIDIRDLPPTHRNITFQYLQNLPQPFVINVACPV